MVLLSFPFHKGEKWRYREATTNWPSHSAGMRESWDANLGFSSRAHTLCHMCLRNVCFVSGKGTFPEILDWIPKIFTRSFPLLLEGWCFLPLRFSLLSLLSICRKNLGASIYSPNIHWLLAVHRAVQRENGRFVLDFTGKMHIIML